MRSHTSCLLLALVIALCVPASAVAQLTDIDCAAIFDSNGTRVARAQSVGPYTIDFLKVHNGFPIFLQIFDNNVRGSDDKIWFTDANCGSTPFVDTENGYRFAPGAVVNQEVYYPDPEAVPQFLQAYSYRVDSDASCQPIVTNVNAASPAIGQFSVSQYTPPFHLESEACYTPPPVVAALTPFGLGAMAFVLAFGAYMMARRPGNT